MPFRCCVPSCSGNYGYGNSPKVTVFSFPENKNLEKKWLSAIQRVDFTPSKFSKVCELHFQKDDIFRQVDKIDKKTGQHSTCSLKRLRLKAGAIPSIFANFPENQDESCPTASNNSEDKISEIEEASILGDIKEIKADYTVHQESISFESFDGLLEILDSFPNKQNWIKVNDVSKVTFFKVDYNPGPTTNYAVVIYSNLKLETYLYGQEISVEYNDIKTPCKINNIETIENCLNSIDAVLIANSFENCDNSDHNLKRIINHLTNILDKLDRDDVEKCVAFSFLSEQLKLNITQKDRYRYSTSTIIVSSIMHTISSHAYKYLRHSNFLILPHPSTINTICNNFLTNTTDEDKKLFLAYARNIFKHLQAHEQNVMLLMDQIHIKPYLDFKGGNIIGNTFNDSSLYTCAYTFMVSSATTKLNEVIHICPTCTIKSDTLYGYIQTVITKLEEIGYRVFCVISENNALNGKAMHNFSPKKQLSIVYPHPSDNNRPLFFLYNPVHLLKCVKNNWLNPKGNKILSFPDFKTGEKRIANFNSLILLQQLEHKLSKLGHYFSLRALFRTNFEHQNVSLTLKIFNPFVKEALLKFGTNIENSVETADFINIISTWCNIINVKTLLNGQQLRDDLETAIRSENPDDPKLLFLREMITWLDTWKSGVYPHKLASETHTALCHTIHGMLEIVQYCFQELKMSYVLLGKFQTDPLENRFGKYRQFSGGQYHISIRQLYESEKKLRIRSLLTLTSRTFGNIPIKQFSEYLDHFYGERKYSDNSLNPEIYLEESDFQQAEHEMSVITYLAGYFCYKILRKFKCELCKSGLVYDEQMVVEDNYNLIKSLSREGLSFPQDTVVHVVLINFILFNKLLQNYEDEFLNMHYKMHFVSSLVFKYWQLHGSEKYKLEICDTHKRETILKLIINSTTNTLLKNYCGKTNKRKLDLDFNN